MRMFFPSTYPSSRRPCRNASMRAGVEEGKAETRYPIRGTFVGCWASAKETVDNRVAAKRQTINFVFIVSASRLSNHLVCSRQDVGWNRQANLFCRFKIDRHLKLHRCFHGQVRRLRPLENLIHVGRGAAVVNVEVCSV